MAQGLWIYFNFFIFKCKPFFLKKKTKQMLNPFKFEIKGFHFTEILQTQQGFCFLISHKMNWSPDKLSIKSPSVRCMFYDGKQSTQYSQHWLSVKYPTSTPNYHQQWR